MFTELDYTVNCIILFPRKPQEKPGKDRKKENYDVSKGHKIIFFFKII